MRVDFPGVWKADLERSNIVGPLPNAIAVSITHSDTGIREELIVIRPDGREERVVFTCSTDGKPGANRLGGRDVEGSAVWEGDQLVIRSRIKAGSPELNLC